MKKIRLKERRINSNNWLKIWLKSCNQEIRKKIKTEELSRIKTAAACIWEAYNIYDDIIDGDQDAAKLPRANMRLRSCFEAYRRLKLPEKFYSYFNRLFDATEKANLREMQYRKSNYNQPLKTKFERRDLIAELSDKSLLISSAPLAALFLSGSATKENINSLISIFRNILSAKQLSDDACDWLEDRRAHKWNPVTATLQNRTRRLAANRETAACWIFAEDVAPEIAKLILKFAHDAIEASKTAPFLKDYHFTTLALKSQILAAHKALRASEALKML